MKRHRFTVSLSAEEWLGVYSGSISNLVVRSTKGMRISIPIRNFIPFVTYSGIQGTFEVDCFENRILELRKL